MNAFAQPGAGRDGSVPDPHPAREVLFVLVTALHLCLPAWLHGGEVPWGPPAFIASGMAAAALGWLLRRERARAGLITPSWWRSPLPWSGMAVLVLVSIQMLNTGWEVVPRPDGFELHPVDAVRWLPAGTRAAWADGNAARWLATAAGAWLGIVAIALGVHRRRTAVWLLSAGCASATGIALLGLLERAAGVRPSAAFASFPYRNHAAAFLVLWLAVALALAAHHHGRSLERARRSGPDLLFLLFAFLLALASVYSASRAGTLLCLALLAAAAGAKLVQTVRRGPRRSNVLGAAGVALLLAGLAVVLVGVLDLPHVVDRLRSTPLDPAEISADARIRGDRAAFELLKTVWPGGCGAGAFQYHFPPFQAREPLLAPGVEVKVDHGIVRVRRRPAMPAWKHAHNEYLQLPIEFGLAGVVLAVAGSTLWIFCLLRARAWQSTPALLLLAGLLANLAHAAVDYVFQSPALLISWTAVAALALRWAQSSRLRTRPGEAGD